MARVHAALLLVLLLVAAAPAAPEESGTSTVLGAARAFLDALPPPLRERAALPFGDPRRLSARETVGVRLSETLTSEFHAEVQQPAQEREQA